MTAESTFTEPHEFAIFFFAFVISQSIVIRGNSLTLPRFSSGLSGSARIVTLGRVFRLKRSTSILGVATSITSLRVALPVCEQMGLALSSVDVFSIVWRQCEVAARLIRSLWATCVR
jgi:hypothetical protein